MANVKKYDLVVKTGEYESQSGTKGRYKNIGAIIEGDKGPFLMLDATIISSQLFALINKDGRERILVSMFEADRDGAKTERAAPPAQSRPAQAAPKQDPDDEIPF